MIKYLLIFLVIFSSCKKVEELVTFDITKSEKFTIQATGVSLPTDSILAPLTSVPTNTTTEFKNNRSETKYAKDVKLTKLNFEINSPPSATFNFLKSIEIYISSPGIAEKLIAYNRDVPRGVKSFELTTIPDKLDDYIKAETYSLRVKAVVRETVPVDTQVTSNMIFRVTAKIL